MELFEDEFPFLDRNKVISELCLGKRYYNYKVFQVGPLETVIQKEVVESLLDEDSIEVQLLQDAPRIGSPVDLVVAPEDVTMATSILDEASIPQVMVMDNLQIAMNKAMKTNQNNRKRWHKSQRTPRDTSQRSHDQFESRDDASTSQPPEHFMRFCEQLRFIEYLAENSGIAVYSSFGSSYQGRVMPLITINGHMSELPGLWLDAGIHPREWITHAALIHILETILFAQTPEAIHLRTNYRIYVAPNLNPDGYVHTWTTDRLWRKNMHNATARGWGGVDINRNFNAEFGSCFTGKYPRSPIYGGPFAESEPETQAIVNAILDIQNNRGGIQTIITLHSFTQRWVAPWGSRRSVPGDAEKLVGVANKAVEAIKQTSGFNYTAGTAQDVIYCFSGSLLDWAKNNGEIRGTGAGIPYVYLVELRPECCGTDAFLVEPSQIAPTAKEIFAGIYAALEAIAENTANES